jgi:hypothetical protein
MQQLSAGKNPGADYPIKGPRWLKNRQKYRSFFAKYGEIAGFFAMPQGTADLFALRK